MPDSSKTQYSSSLVHLIPVSQAGQTVLRFGAKKSEPRPTYLRFPNRGQVLDLVKADAPGGVCVSGVQAEHPQLNASVLGDQNYWRQATSFLTHWGSHWTRDRFALVICEFSLDPDSTPETPTERPVPRTLFRVNPGIRRNATWKS